MSRPFFYFFFYFFYFFERPPARVSLSVPESFSSDWKRHAMRVIGRRRYQRGPPPPLRTRIYGRFAAIAPLVVGPLPTPPFCPSLLIAFANSSGCVNYLYFLRSPTYRACNNAQFVITLCLSLPLFSPITAMLTN